jgi:phosphoglucosamine mutase
VRGLVNSFLTPTLACKVGSAVATHTKAKKAVVARDTRLSGLMIEDALVSGLLSSGTDVWLASMVPTPALAYVTKGLKADIGFMLTASHNPPQYNGIKIFNGDSLAFIEQDQIAIEKIVVEGLSKFAEWKDLGQSCFFDANQMYINMALKAVNLHKKWRVIVDPGCGATFNIAPTIFKAMGCKVTALNAQPDGYFPARKSEPTADSLKDLSNVVKSLGADVGIAFDGDGDRVGLVDETGTFVDFDRSLSAYAAYVLKQGTSGGTVVTNVEASMCIEKMVEAQGGRIIRTKVGDIYISEAIKRDGALFGGEPCGAWVHPQHHYCPDGPLSAALILKALEDENKSLSEFISQVPKYFTLRENIPCKNDLKNKAMIGIIDKLKSTFLSCANFSTIDGVRVSLNNGWLLVRASGTEPLIRLTVEGETLQVAKDIVNKTVALIKNVIDGEAA